MKPKIFTPPPPPQSFSSTRRAAAAAAAPSEAPGSCGGALSLSCVFPRAGLPPNAACLRVRRAKQESLPHSPPAACVAIQASLQGQKIYVPGFVAAKASQANTPDQRFPSTPSVPLFSSLSLLSELPPRMCPSPRAQRWRRTLLTDEQQRSALSARARSLLSLRLCLRRPV